MRRPLIAGNWKMHLDHVAAIRLIQDLALRLRSLEHSVLEVAVFPPFTDLRSVESILGADRLPVLLGAQHCSPHEEGAYTGEISLSMLARLSVTMVLVGHSERRQLFAMTDEQVAATTRAVLAREMTPVICVGETGPEREEGSTLARLERQVSAALEGVAPGSEADVVIAYEPIWAIGTGVAAMPEDAQIACEAIRTFVLAQRGDVAWDMRILYGGSAKPENAAELVALRDVDGLLVGGASLDAEAFAAIVAATAGCYGRAAGKS